MLPLLFERGIRWLATDEEILSHSTQGFVSRDHRGHVNNPERMYRPYRVGESDRELGIIFRDHALSDMIGFHYQRSDPVAAAEDLIARLRSIGQAVSGNGPVLVSIILDGENCWEHYPGGGVTFLRALYERCTRQPGIRPWRVGDFLAEHPPRDSLPHLFAGSWISHNFAIWVGHEEDNDAWDALHRTREYLRRKEADRDKETAASLDRAWEEIHIAEGSDWFWWYGDEHSSAQDALFDYLFRKHLQNVYRLLGDVPPAELDRPINRRVHHRSLHSQPSALLEVKVDGKLTFFEWVGAGCYTCVTERGTMAMGVRGPLKEVFFGFSLSDLFVRIDFESAAREILRNYDALRIGFVEPLGWELSVVSPARPQQAVRLFRRGEEAPAPGLRAGIDQIVEVGLPFDALGIAINQPVRFYVELLQGRQSLDRAPREGTITLPRPSADFEQIMWHV
jgi:hypothetical protein